MGFLKQIQIALTEITLMGPINRVGFIIFHMITALQCTSLLCHPDSNLRTVFFWLDPSNYLPPILFIIIGLLLLVLNIGIIIYKIVNASIPNLMNNKGLVDYNLTFFTSLVQEMLTTVILIPMLRSVML